jgi:hypothetical protein
VLCLTATEGRARPGAAGAAATAQAAAASYARHVPERTLLYALVQAHYPDFLARLEAEDRSLPKHVHEEFQEYLRCGVLDHSFLRWCASSAMRNGWWRFPARSAGSARVAARGAWPSRRGTW